MPFTSKWMETGIERVATGKVTAEEIIQSGYEMYGDERFDALRYGLADFTQAESFEITNDETKKIAYLDMAAAKSNPNFKLAIVAPQDTTNRLAHFYSAFSENSPWKIEIFNTLDQAKQWLRGNPCEKRNIL